MPFKSQLSFVFAFWFLFICTTATLAEQDQKKIIVLHSYHQGLEWTDSITTGIQSVFLGKEDQYAIHFDYLDTKRNSSPDYFENLEKLYAHKNQKNVYDAIIVSDNNAFNFYLENKALFVGNPPVFFCGVNHFRKSLIEGLDRITGIAETTDFEATIQLMLELHPDAKRIVIVNDQTNTGKAIKAQLAEILPTFEDRVEFEFFERFTLENMTEELPDLGENDLIYLLTFNKDANGKFVSYKYGAFVLRQSTSVPIYGSWDFYLGKGIVGGHIVSGYEQGRTVASMALSVMEGTDIRDIPVIQEPDGNYLFDYVELNRFGISMKQLPRGSVVKNKPNLFDHTFVVVSFFSFFLLLAAFCVETVRRHKERTNRLRLEAEKNELDKQVALRTESLHLSNKQLSTEIEERKNVEEQLRDSNETKDKFFSIIAHDLRNPFWGLISLTEILKGSFKDLNDKERDNIINEIHNQSKSTFQLLQDLLTWANLKQGKITNDPQLIGLRDLISESLSLIQSNAISKNITVSLEMKEDVNLYCDRFMLSTVINNLCGNAIKFTPEQGEITVFASIQGDEVCIRVVDNGMGMSQTEIDELFSITKCPSKLGSHEEPGTGLGLVICKEFVDNMNGSIWAESAGLNQGSTFGFNIPNHLSSQLGELGV